MLDEVCFDQRMLLCSSLSKIVVHDFVSGRAEGKRQTSRQVCQVSYTGSTVLLVSESEEVIKVSEYRNGSTN